MSVEKILKEVPIREIDCDVLSGPILDVIHKLENIYSKEGNNFEDLRINSDYVGYDGGSEFTLYGQRLETDEEFEHRKSQIAYHKLVTKTRKNKQKERELKTLERLKKKYK